MRLVSAGVLLIVSFDTPVGAAPCTEKKLVETYLEARCESDPTFVPPARVLTFSHERREWRKEFAIATAIDTTGPTRDCTVEASKEEAPRERRDATAWTYRAKGRPVLALVTDTNAMLYSATEKATEPKDVDELSSLGKVASLAGGFVSGALSAGGKVLVAARALPPAAVADQPGADGSPAALLLKNDRFLMDTEKLSPRELEALQQMEEALRAQRQAREKQRELAKDLVQFGNSLAAHGEARVTAVEAEVERVKRALRDLQASLQAVASADERVVSYLQAIENRRPPTWLDPAPSELAAAAVDARFGAVADALDALRLRSYVCVEAYETTKDLVGILLTKEPGPRRLTDAAAAAAELADLKTADCSWRAGDGNVTGELDAFQGIGKALKQALAAGDTLPPAPLGLIHAAADQYVSANTNRDALEEKTLKALEARPATISTAAALESLRQRERTRAVRVVFERCDGAGVLEVPTRKDIYRWNTVQPFSFELAADAKAADKVSARRASPGQVTYELEPKAWFRPTVSFGIARARGLAEPAFELIEIDGKKYVERVSEERRSAVATAFVSFRIAPGHFWRELSGFEPGVDVGFGVDPTTPAVYLGASLRFFFGSRFGVGATWQEITALDGQTAVSVRPDGTIDTASLEGREVRAVRTKTTFPRGLYLSVSFPLGTLPFFGPGGD